MALAVQYLGSDLNERDDYAVEEVVQLQEAGLTDEVVIVTVTLGPEDCEQTIRQALAKGADRAICVWDDALEDVDVLDIGAKTDILEAVVNHLEHDLDDGVEDAMFLAQSVEEGSRKFRVPCWK